MARVGPLAGKDIDALWAALRPRIIGIGGGARIPGPQGPAGAKAIVWRGAWAAGENYEEGDLVYSDTAGASRLTYFCLADHTSVNPPTVGGDAWWHEISPGYLIIDGQRAMTGDLNMDEHDIDNAVNGHFSGDINMDGAVGTARIQTPRIISMAGDHVNDEAKIENLERVVFNDEPTASSIEKPSRIEWNTGVSAQSSYAGAEGRSSWDTLEDRLIIYVATGLAVYPIAFGWGIKAAVASSEV